MMTNEIKYRLDEYVIIERDGVFLTWVSHVALGTQLSGISLIIGNILVIGPQKHQEAGFLKLEFNEQLRKLPAWTKTKYYCLASSIRKADTGQSLAHELKVHPYIPRINMVATDIKDPGSFRLGRYKIIVNGNSVISWQSFGEFNRTISGKCVIESGILFIGRKEIESDDGQSRRDFFASQKLLPQWDKTFAWGHYGSLRACKEPKPRKSYAAIWKPERIKIIIGDNIPFVESQKLRKEKISQLKVSGSGWLKTAWHRVIEWNGWGCIKALIIAGIFFGLRILVFILEKLKYLTHTVIARFRKYREK
jgi:hypothetical protein